MTAYFIGLGDGNRQNNLPVATLVPLGGPEAGFKITGVTAPIATMTAAIKASFKATLTPITPTGTVTGTVKVSIKVLRGGIDSTVLAPVATLTQVIGLGTSIGAGALIITPLLLNGTKLATTPIPTADLFAEQTGVRPSLPWQVVTRKVAHIFDLTEDGGATFKIVDNKPFVVASTFGDELDNPLLKLGARHNYIGIILLTATGTRAVRFRPPYDQEVIFDLSDGSTHRYDQTTDTWSSYVTLPQRALRGVKVFDALDPTRIYDYYANILGLMLAQLQYDTGRIQDLVDPARTPDSFLTLLLRNFGADVVFADAPAEDRHEVLRLFVALMKAKGTPAAISTAIGALGYVGHGSHVWAIPLGDPKKDWTTKPFGFDLVAPTNPATDYYPTSGIAVHLNQQDGTPILKIDDAAKQKVAEFLVLNVIPASNWIRVFATDIPAGSDGATVSDTLTITP